MQFIVIEWKVYELTGDPLYLGFIGLMEIIPALLMALFAGHIVDQREKRNLLALCISAFSLKSFTSISPFSADCTGITFHPTI